MRSTLALLRHIRENRHKTRRVLFVGQSYYHAWNLSRELRKLGWAADLLNYDASPENAIYYHGEDFRFDRTGRLATIDEFLFFLLAAAWYRVFFFSGMGGLLFGGKVPHLLRRFGKGADVRFLRWLGRRIMYSHNGCQDGVSQTSFSRWGPHNTCAICSWKDRPDVCSDERNLAWGRFRNALADYQVANGGNRIDYNLDPRVHEVPQFYCINKENLRPDLTVPDKYRLTFRPQTVKLYHAVGHYDVRAGALRETVKSTHIYLPLIDRLRAEGRDVELLFFKDVPNRDIRYYQVQADIVLDMLTFGFFGSTAREAMMLGKPVVCFLRPEWLETMRQEIPEYVDELPIVSATPETVYDVVLDLIDHPAKRVEIGRKSREFAVRWHSSDAAGRHFDVLLQQVMAGQA